MEASEEKRFKRRLGIHICLIWVGIVVLAMGGWEIISAQFSLIVVAGLNGLQEFFDYKGKY